jgi:hypothetical protein
METQNKRYDFGGSFTFGSNGLFQLVVRNITEHGGYTMEFGLELTPAERQKLITLLITLNTEEEN